MSAGFASLVLLSSNNPDNNVDKNGSSNPIYTTIENTDYKLNKSLRRIVHHVKQISMTTSILCHNPDHFLLVGVTSSRRRSSLRRSTQRLFSFSASYRHTYGSNLFEYRTKNKQSCRSYIVYKKPTS
ncbi:hypothetical protein Q3G72_006221 [Acer saccharum]|nr:hypothetical protein Q3G72_006221 [Acer saccharum]